MQLTKVAKVKGSGMDAADFVAITLLNAARGLANRMMQMMTPSLPISLLVLLAPLDTSRMLDNIIAYITLKCCDTVPGKLVAVGQQCFWKMTQ